MVYDLKTANAPRLSGVALEAAALALENPATGLLLGQKLLQDLGIFELRRASLSESPTVAPNLPRLGSLAAEETEKPNWESILQSKRPIDGFAFESAADFTRAYREGRADPVRVAELFWAEASRLDEGQSGMHVFIERNEALLLESARQSRERYRAGAPLGPLDGVPITVKDELDAKGYHTTVGTKFIKTLAGEDAAAVARLRAAGALILGKVNMHEIGIDTSGFNAHHGTPTNPYGKGHYPGGSSSGSAASVAAGFAPISIGADGGGSIRIPASLCGVVGLKATWSRISERGAFPLCASVGHVGPIGATVRDTALAYMLMAGEDPLDHATLLQPAPHLRDFEKEDLSGIRIGIFTPWLEHATTDVTRAAKEALGHLVERGAKVVEVSIAGLDQARVAQAVTILCEMASYMEAYDAEHRRDYGLGVRINLSIARALTGRDYVQAQRVRARFSAVLAKVFDSVDLLLTPTTALSAPRIADDVAPRGESNLEVTSGLMRFVFPFNLSGNPALTLPSGYGPSGLPLGVQLVGRPWEEHLLFRAAQVIESRIARRKPAIGMRYFGD